MVFWDVSFKIKYDYPFARISGSYPGNRVTMWCVWDVEIIQVPGHCEDMITEIEKLVGRLKLSIEGHRRSNEDYVLRLKCSCGILHNVWNIMHSHSCYPIHPAYFLDGWGHYKMVSSNEEDIKNLIRELESLGTVELTKKRAAYGDTLPPSGWIRDFVSGLTGMQMKSLEKAFDLGYFSSPRRVTVRTIADTLGISRSTCEEHLREAENKIMAEIMPFTRLIRTHDELYRNQTSNGDERKFQNKAGI